MNVGGRDFTDAQGNYWIRDEYDGGTVTVTEGPIGNTSDSLLYGSSRWAHSSMTYVLRIPAGRRTVTLKFAELRGASTELRPMNISINGVVVLRNFDIAAAAGGVRIAVDRTFETQSNGEISINLSAAGDDGVTFNGLEIR